MAKVLRLHKGAADTIEHWDNSSIIGTNAIDSIEDPIGATDKREITSIPSPFARMDLIKRAFKIVAEGSDSLDGKTAYHKLVSDCLDVGQIFFNIEKYRKFVEIVVWDKKTGLDELLVSDYEGHRRLGKTYQTYLRQDYSEYNFDKMDCIYLLNYIDPTAPNEMNIIGATSPATVFFTSANNLKYVGKKIKFGNDTPFDDDYKPLYMRDFEYVKYWWGLKNSRKEFAREFPEVDRYLEKSFRKLNDKQREELRQVNSNFYLDNYDEIPITSSVQQYVMILDEKLRKKRSITNINSEFEMKISNSLYKIGMQIPLALPVEKYTEPTFYVVANWDKNTHVSYYDERPINDRTLPDDGAVYPYVTVSDFLEDSIVKLPFKFNPDGFFNGNDEGLKKQDAKDSYLLPLKKAYFDYFTVDDLTGTINGKNCIEINRLAGDSVKVVLRIPIKKGYIQYERIYYKDGRIDVDANKGAIVECRFTLGLYPSIKYSNNTKPIYRIALLDRGTVSMDTSNTYNISFYNANNNELSPLGVVYRNRNNDNSRYDKDFIDSAIYALDSEYQYMRINDIDKNIHGVVIPRFSSKNGGRKFRFAIDFGTTNTHIEYSIDGEASKPFDISEKDLQIQKLHIDEDFYIRSTFNSDMVPNTIGGDSLFGYPMRTVISEGNNTNWSKAVIAMGNVNIPYTYEKSMALPYNVLHTDLKWSTNIEDKQRAAKYVECLLLMIRNKVLLNNGDLSKTEIVWFYPASMTQNRFNRFKDTWVKTFVSLFDAPINNIIAVSESVAPYYYHKAKKGATSTVVSVDIGGGTTDVLIVDKGEPKYLTSFRFAANTIFGDGYSYDSETNGLVNKYKGQILNQLEINKFGALKNVFKSVLEKKNSTDIMAFLFSLSANKEIQKANVKIDFAEMLADDSRGKYVVLLFYVAIMYHIANLMKAKGYDMPRHITFSGNGSKVLNILSSNDDTLVKFTKIIFEEIYKQTYSRDGLDIIRPANSKESTCKGGIILNPFQSQDYSEIKDMKTVLLGSDSSTFADNEMTYEDVTDEIKDKVVATVESYIDFAFNLDHRFSFFDNFEIDRSIKDRVKDLCLRDVKTYLDNGLSNKKRDIEQDGADDKLEETLFFYPLVGILNAVVRNIYKL